MLVQYSYDENTSWMMVMSIVHETKSEMGLTPDFIITDDNHYIAFNEADFKAVVANEMTIDEYNKKNSVLLL